MLALQPRRDPDFEARCASWVPRGAAHDRRLRRRLALAAPLVVAVTFAYVLFVR